MSTELTRFPHTHVNLNVRQAKITQCDRVETVSSDDNRMNNRAAESNPLGTLNIHSIISGYLYIF